MKYQTNIDQVEGSFLYERLRRTKQYPTERVGQYICPKGTNILNIFRKHSFTVPETFYFTIFAFAYCSLIVLSFAISAPLNVHKASPCAKSAFTMRSAILQCFVHCSGLIHLFSHWDLRSGNIILETTEMIMYS